MNDESDDAPESPRKKRKVVDNHSDELSTLSPSPVASTKPIPDNKPPPSSSPLTIYDEIPGPQPAAHDVKKILEKAKVVSRTSSHSKVSSGDREKGPVAGPSRIVEKKTESNNLDEELRKQANGTKKRGKSRSAAPEGDEDGKEMRDAKHVRKRAERVVQRSLQIMRGRWEGVGSKR